MLETVERRLRVSFATEAGSRPFSRIIVSAENEPWVDTRMSASGIDIVSLQGWFIGACSALLKG